jgi:hypothetical protein
MLMKDLLADKVESDIQGSCRLEVGEVVDQYR